MKQYQTPCLEELSLQAEDLITASGVISGIVAPEDQAGASDTQETTWKDNWS